MLLTFEVECCCNESWLGVVLLLVTEVEDTVFSTTTMLVTSLISNAIGLVLSWFTSVVVGEFIFVVWESIGIMGESIVVVGESTVVVREYIVVVGESTVVVRESIVVVGESTVVVGGSVVGVSVGYIDGRGGQSGTTSISCVRLG